VVEAVRVTVAHQQVARAQVEKATLAAAATHQTRRRIVVVVVVEQAPQVQRVRIPATAAPVRQAA
jgi:hypothetical protein